MHIELASLVSRSGRPRGRAARAAAAGAAACSASGSLVAERAPASGSRRPPGPVPRPPDPVPRLLRFYCYTIVRDQTYIRPRTERALSLSVRHSARRRRS